VARVNRHPIDCSALEPYKRRHAATFLQVEQFCYSLVLITTSLLAVGCSAAPTSDPHDTRPIPESARFEGKCTFLGEIG